jgi:hypothetical protein
VAFTTHTYRLCGFLAATLLIYVAIFTLTHSPLAASRSARIAWGALADLVLTVPALYYLLLVRPGYASWVPMVAIGLAGARATAFVLPETMRMHLVSLPWLLAPVEVWVLARIVQRVRRNAATAACDDPIERLQQAAQLVLRHPVVARMVAEELAVFYYALFSWRAQPQMRPGTRDFSCGEASGYHQFALVIGLAVVFEGIAMHLLLHQWSPMAAWILTALDAYALLWLTAVSRSLHLRPMLFDGEVLHLRIGLLWQAEIPLREIRRISPVTQEALPAGCRTLTFLNPPHLCLEMKAPLRLRGPYGFGRSATSIAIAVDDPASLAAALHH